MALDYHMIGRRIARRRKKLRLTQAKVAELCDITNQYLSNIERATSVPSLETIMRLAAALDTTPDEFLVGAARPEKGRMAQRGRTAAHFVAPAVGTGAQFHRMDNPAGRTDLTFIKIQGTARRAVPFLYFLQKCSSRHIANL